MNMEENLSKTALKTCYIYFYSFLYCFIALFKNANNLRVQMYPLSGKKTY